MEGHKKGKTEHGEALLVHPVKITNTVGTSFHVMANELLEFMAKVVREQQIKNIKSTSDAKVLGFDK